MQQIIDRMTLATLIKYAGTAITADDAAALNAALNAIREEGRTAPEPRDHP